MSPLFANLFGIDAIYLIGLLLLGLLIFGRRLPDISKYLGKSIVEFKKGMRGLEDGFDDHAGGFGQQPYAQPGAQPAPMPNEAIRPPQRVTATAPKFEDAPPVNTHVTTNPPQV
jgi:sec-independent protein translocase protein TatA